MKYSVTTQELVAMAEVIACQKPPVKTPSVVTTLLRSAIALRKRCSQWFSEQSSQQAAKNETHSHFITVLEKILQLLQPTGPDESSEQTLATTISPNQGTDSQVDTLNNIFDVLNIEESEMEEIQSPETTVVTTRTTPLWRYEVEPDDEEVYFALYCFFDDLNRLRDHLQDLWEDYKDGEEDLVSASVTTNMAFQLVKQAEEELIATLPKFKSRSPRTNITFSWRVS